MWQSLMNNAYMIYLFSLSLLERVESKGGTNMEGGEQKREQRFGAY